MAESNNTQNQPSNDPQNQNRPNVEIDHEVCLIYDPNWYDWRRDRLTVRSCIGYRQWFNLRSRAVSSAPLSIAETGPTDRCIAARPTLLLLPPRSWITDRKMEDVTMHTRMEVNPAHNPFGC